MISHRGAFVVCSTHAALPPGFRTEKKMNCRSRFLSNRSSPHIPVVRSLSSFSLQNWLNAPPVPSPLSRNAALNGCTNSSLPSASPSIDVGSKNVLAMNTPPGRNTLDISATAADGDGQQCIAAPACTAVARPRRSLG